MRSLCKMDNCVECCIDSKSLIEIHLMDRSELSNFDNTKWFFDDMRATYYLPCDYCHNIYLDRNRLARIE